MQSAESYTSAREREREWGREKIIRAEAAGGHFTSPPPTSRCAGTTPSGDTCILYRIWRRRRRGRGRAKTMHASHRVGAGEFVVLLMPRSLGIGELFCLRRSSITRLTRNKSKRISFCLNGLRGLARAWVRDAARAALMHLRRNENLQIPQQL